MEGNSDAPAMCVKRRFSASSLSLRMKKKVIWLPEANFLVNQAIIRGKYVFRNNYILS